MKLQKQNHDGSFADEMSAKAYNKFAFYSWALKTTTTMEDNDDTTPTPHGLLTLRRKRRCWGNPLHAELHDQRGGFRFDQQEWEEEAEAGEVCRQAHPGLLGAHHPHTTCTCAPSRPCRWENSIQSLPYSTTTRPCPTTRAHTITIPTAKKIFSWLQQPFGFQHSVVFNIN